MTTVSIINPEVTYRESKNIDEEDIGYKSQVYELDTDGNTITIVIGKPKYTYTDKHIIFFLIYAVHKSRVRSQIGVFEVKSTQLLNIYKNGELDLRRLSKPLYYSFSTPIYLATLEADPKFFKEPLTPSHKDPIESDEPESILDADIEKEDHLSLRFENASVSKEKTLLENVEGFKAKDPLLEETKETADEEREEYKKTKSSKDIWIQKYMKNQQYRIHEVESNGDCLFAVIRDAFADIGKKTSVEKLRDILAAEMTDDIYNEYRKVYLSFLDEIQSLNRDLSALEKTIKEYLKRIKQITDKTTADGKDLTKRYRELEDERTHLKRKINETENNQTLYTGNMKQIDTLEKMRQYIKTSCWADAWAISTLERILNVKLLLFSQHAFEPEEGEPDLDGVLLCSEASKELQERQTFTPDYYIMATYSGDHYRLISYKSRKIFQFREVPYDVKILVLNRCLSRLSGVYYMIQDFRNFKTKFGIDEDEGAPEDYANLEGNGELFDANTILVFCANSDSKIKPGEASGEKIPASDKSKYAKLNTKYNGWRKKLDDDWSKNPMMIEGMKWTSVTHYMQGVQYKKTHPDVYRMFSLTDDEESDLAKNVKTAKAFKGIVKEVEQDTEPNAKKTKKPKKQIQVIAPDLDFDGKRQEEEREKALKSKFHDNEIMRSLLKATGNALLIHKCGSGEKATHDLELMRARIRIKN